MSIRIGNSTFGATDRVKFGGQSLEQVLFNGIIIWEKEKSGSMKKNCLFGNWKMNLTLSESIALVNQLKSQLDQNEIEVALAPSLVNIHGVHEVIKDTNISLIAQDVSAYEKGSYTGQVSARQLAAVGVKYVLINHSEVRAFIHNADLNKVDLAGLAIERRKISRCIANGLTPIVCVGEGLEVREAGTTEEFLRMQLKTLFNGMYSEEIAKCILCYEPIWAVGTGKTISHEEAESICGLLRRFIQTEYCEVSSANMSILFAGSVIPANCLELYSKPDIDGFVAASASLTTAFADILNLMRG